MSEKSLVKNLKREYESLRDLWNELEVVGKALRTKGEPSYRFRPLFEAQIGIEKARNAIREAMGALS